MKNQTALTLADFELIKQAIHIAVEDGSLLRYASLGRIDLLRSRLQQLEETASR